jgi:hypothetical protein
MIGRNSIGGGLILGALLSFGYGGLKVYESKKDLSIASREATATAQVRVNFSDPLRPKSERNDGPDCTYTFHVGDAIHRGHGWCPSELIYQGAVESLQFRSEVHPEPVYFDPSDPETNSLFEFREKSELDGKGASLFFILGAAISMLAVLAFVLGKTQVDAVAQLAPEAPQTRQPSATDFMDNLDQILERERREDQSSK